MSLLCWEVRAQRLTVVVVVVAVTASRGEVDDARRCDWLGPSVNVVGSRSICVDSALFCVILFHSAGFVIIHGQYEEPDWQARDRSG